jgi:hypothetical protein
MVAYSSSGTVLWDIPNDQPMIATAGIGVIDVRGTVYDQNGAPIGTSPLRASYYYVPGAYTVAQAAVVQSWTGLSCSSGSVEQRFLGSFQRLA